MSLRESVCLSVRTLRAPDWLGGFKRLASQSASASARAMLALNAALGALGEEATQRERERHTELRAVRRQDPAVRARENELRRALRASQ